MTVHSLLGAMPRREEYPESWDEYIGQDDVKRQIQVAARSARIRDDVMDHMLIHSPFAGVGKTALAFLVAKELGKPIRVLSGKASADDMRVILAQAARGDVIFYDEVHNVVVGNKKAGDWLLTFLENGVIVGPRGPEKQPKVTFIGATTNVRMLPEPIRSRFAKSMELGRYSLDEAVRIAELMVGKFFAGVKPPSRQNLEEIAFAANNNPRMIRNVLTNLRDLIVTDEADTQGTGWDVQEALDWAGVTPDGLTFTALKYLGVLLDSKDTRAGKEAIAERLHEENGLGDVERLLIDKDLIQLTGRGRMLTQAGIQRALAFKETA